MFLLNEICLEILLALLGLYRLARTIASVDHTLRRRLADMNLGTQG